MKVVIDTSSLLSLVRYYLPFDTNDRLFKFIQNQIENGGLIIIDEVLNECKFTSKGLVLDKLTYLTDKEFRKVHKIPTKTKDLLPPSTRKFYNLVDNNFRTPLSRRLNDAEFEQRKKEFLSSADARMIIYALNERHSNSDLEIILVTEETETANDNKAFKKIPSICNILKIEVITLPDLLEKYNGINIEFN
ncbi:MAG: DUF4411 family protein [Melioribacteraceae bacterium]|nr:DUF4411 family protein [Melioribacteraceae bacterium]